MSILETHCLSCRFDGVSALEAVSVRVEEGERVGILGPNAAGKTTLLNAVCGLVPIASGSIVFCGMNVTRWPFHRRAAAGLIRSFEDQGTWRLVSTLDNVAAGAYGISLREARARAERRLEEVDLFELREEPAANLSIGQQRLVGIARILLRQEMITAPALLLLDEPFRGIDRTAKQSVLRVLRERLPTGSSLILVEHDRAAAAQLCDRFVHMKRGRVIDNVLPETVAPESDDQPVADIPPALPPYALRVEDVRAAYGAAEILRGVTFSVGWGEALQIGGPNGSGKSTLFRVITGALSPLGGRIEIMGKGLESRASRVSMGLGYAPQGGRLATQLTVGRHLDLARRAAGGRAHQPANSRNAFLEAFPEVRGLLALHAGQLSSGQRSLVALGTALATEPRILLVDEPGAGLEAALRRRVYDFLQNDWLDASRSLVFIEHGSPQPWARQLRLDAGRVAA